MDSSLTNLILAWKMAILLAPTTAKCSDLTLLHIDNQHLFLQHNVAIFIVASCGKIDRWSSSISNLYLILLQFLSLP